MMDYENLYHLTWQNMASLSILLSNDLIIQEINPAAETVLNIRSTEVAHKHLNELFKEKGLEPLFPEHTSIKLKKSLVWRNDKKWTINWMLLPAYESMYLLVGNIEATPLDIPLETHVTHGQF
ncbi:hypothetical protein [Legionella sp. km772]|uniref:hypothetical protein n=1 Tax=Legionella sp. km772 TaxID=2498111 RepID=UPI000F8D672B|nr:hypothetical protein [Legionella sp. km772]RUR04369.1 hypothetical protein ELY15_15590 [Legionella sp. km772]